MIKLHCDCGNEDPTGFDKYVSQGEFCDILIVVCKYCGAASEELIASIKGTITL
ncbi:MAG: hypothetical protein GX949_04370 [Peptococcaceae bacterium]|jgi:hypothetical protein|nr:hypothetical protein [Peptococcaceae bacterium]